MGNLIKDVNFGLFILILGTLITFAGFTVYFQNTFTNLSIEYHTKLGELEKVTNTLQNEKSRLNLTSYQLKIKAERETDLSNKYDTIRSEKENLEKEKAELESELTKTKSDLNEKSSQLSSTKEKLESTESTLTTANAEIANLNTVIASLNTKVSSLNQQISDNDNKIDSLCAKLTELGESC